MINATSSMAGAEPMTQAALDFRRVEKAIAYLQDHFLEQPDLASVAQATHLSEFHFQRVFSRWAGISPKRFLQFLTVEHAKQQLTRTRAVLDVTFDSGLSSPDRLHDLFVSVEAVTPGEFKTRGAGVQIDYGFHATRFGECLLGVTQRGVCWLSFVPDGGREKALRDLKLHWGGAAVTECAESTTPVARRVFSGLESRANAPLNVLLLGTNFQLK